MFGLDPRRARRRGPPPPRLPARRPPPLRAADRPRARCATSARSAGSARSSDGELLAERLELDLDRPIRALSKGQPAEGRPRPGAHAPARAPRARRADVRPRPARAAGRSTSSSARRPPTAARCSSRRTSSRRCSTSPIGSRLIRDGRLVLVETVEALRAPRARRTSRSRSPSRRRRTPSPPSRACASWRATGTSSGSRLDGPADPLVKALARFEVHRRSTATRPTSRTSSSRSTAASRRCRSVLAKTLRDAAPRFVWWSLGLVGLVAMIIAVYPSIRDNPELNRLVEEYPEALKAFIAFGGAARLRLGRRLPRQRAVLVHDPAAPPRRRGRERRRRDRGRGGARNARSAALQPVTRGGVALEKLAALAAELVALGACSGSRSWVGGWSCRHGRPGRRPRGRDVTARCCSRSPFGAIAFLLGAATGHEALAIGVDRRTRGRRVSSSTRSRRSSSVLEPLSAPRRSTTTPRAIHYARALARPRRLPRRDRGRGDARRPQSSLRSPRRRHSDPAGAASPGPRRAR